MERSGDVRISMAASLIAIGLRSTVSGKKSNLIFFVLKDPFTFFSKIECLANLAFAQCKNPPILPQSYKLRLKSITHTERRQCTHVRCVCRSFTYVTCRPCIMHNCMPGLEPPARAAETCCGEGVRSNC